jgi:asparagine synthase (glutamine-hydrolysing)
MCGIFAYVGEESVDIGQGLARMGHRGPDHLGLKRNEGVTLGHCRLSIIDLSNRGNQPMESRSRSSSISFNGEIYNYRSLREELSREGASFATESDTEVILEGYERHGTDFFSKLRGMWAFVLHDVKKRELLCSRDPFGIKPLYYTVQDGALYVASELRALKAMHIPLEPDPAAYATFFALGYFAAPATPYKAVYKLQPGEVTTWSLREKKMESLARISRFAASEAYTGRTYEDALDALERTLLDSVDAHYVADVPVSILLSGGNDSSLIAALSKKLGRSPTAYHIAVPGSPDTDYAARVARELAIPLVSEPLSERAFAEEYERMGETLDEPTGDLSIIPTTLVYRHIKGRTKVVLSGEGGDELFGGYTRNRLLQRHSVVSRTNGLNSFFNALVLPNHFGIAYWNPLVQRTRELCLAHRVSDDLVGAYLKSTRLIDYPLYDAQVRETLVKLFTAGYDERLPRSLAFDALSYLPNDLLYKSDNASMASSIEARVPFVDRVLASAVAGILPTIDTAHSLNDKRILKDVLARHLPRDLVFRPKAGFGVPMHSYDSLAFSADFERAAAFHLAHRDAFGVSEAMAGIIGSATTRAAVVRKFPRFAFALITNWKLFRSIS